MRRSRRALCRAGLQGCLRAVNAVSLYVEHGAETFRSVHVHSAQRVADEARRAGVKRTSRGAATRTQLGVERRRCVGGDRCYVAAPLDDRRLRRVAKVTSSNPPQELPLDFTINGVSIFYGDKPYRFASGTGALIQAITANVEQFLTPHRNP